MRIKRAEFLTSLTGGQKLPEVPQIAVVGKSNVGKSSLINCLCGQNKLARVSAEPGKTRLINLYRINDSFLLVDLPGYGYARVSYFEGATRLAHVLHLVDMRHEPGENDVQMQAFLQHNRIPCTVVATKCDKLSRAQRQKAVLLLCRTLGVQPWEVQPVSSVTREGREELIDRIGVILGEEDEA